MWEGGGGSKETLNCQVRVTESGGPLGRTREVQGEGKTPEKTHVQRPEHSKRGASCLDAEQTAPAPGQEVGGILS